MHAQDCQPPTDVRLIQHHLAVEATGAQQRGVEHVGPVGGGHHDHVGIRIEAIHLDEHLVECLLALVVRATQPRAALAPYGVDLVHEDRSEEHTSELQSHSDLVCRLLLEKKKKKKKTVH